MSTEVTLERTIATLPAPLNGLQPFHRVGSNAYITRSIEGNTQLILHDTEAPAQSFNLKHAKLQSGISFVSNASTSLENCLVLEFDLGIDAHAIAKVSEHLTRSEGIKTGSDLLHSLDVFRSLVENDSFGWSFKRIVSLWGELAFLERLLSNADSPLKQLRCVQAWQSSAIHCQDFCFTDSPVALDVKTTTQKSRLHEVTSVDQVARQEREELYLASSMIRPMGPEEGWSVVDLLQRIRNDLSGESLELFNESIERLDLELEACSAHYFSERNNRPLRLISACDVPGVSQFTPLPAGVPNLSWPIHLPEQGSSDMELDEMIYGWLSAYNEVIQDE
jgi:hypothetical protein